MSRDIIKCEQCGKAVTPEEVESGSSVVCPSCADNAQKESCCSDSDSKSSKRSGCCCG